MKTVFIVNPVAGGRDISADLQKMVEQTVQKHNLQDLQFEVVRTTHAGHATELAQQYAGTGEEVRLFAVGGDGTLNEVFAGAYRYKNAAVGCLPYGSGNDFLRNFGTKEEFQDLADQLMGGTVEIDLFETEFGVGASICSVGLDAQIAYDIPKFRRIPLCGGETAYKLSILRNLIGPLSRKLDITLDGERMDEECVLTAFCNGGYYGGGFYAAPECSMDDGLLDVMIVKKMGLLRIAKVLPVYQKGLHLVDGSIVPALADVVEFRRCRTAEIRVADGAEKPIVANVDGECHSAGGLSVRILPQAGRVILPAKVLARKKVHLTK